MIYISYGMPKSGSTLAFKLTRQLLEACGHPQEQLPPPLVEGHRVFNFLPKHSLDEETLKAVEAAVPQGRIVVFKTHAAPSDAVFRLAAEGRLMAHAVFRDPRDNVLSLRDAGERAAQRGSRPFSHIGNLDAAVRTCGKNLADFERWLSVPTIETADYEQVAFGTHGFLERIARQLQLDISAIDLGAVEAAVKQPGNTKVNKGVSRRHRDELSVNECVRLTAHFREVLERHLPQPDAIDAHIIAAARLSRSPNVRDPAADGETGPAADTPTKKTFVVLGCPRGGTSLLAGALSCCGIHMGDFRTRQYEDPDFKIPPREAQSARERLLPAIEARNRRHAYWGWKVPNNIYYIRDVMDLLHEPQYLFIYRDPEEIARSSAKHDKRNWKKQRERLLEVAHNHTALLKEFEAALDGNCHVFQLEAIHQDPHAFVDRLLAIVSPLQPSRDELLRFIDPRGGYHFHGGVPDGKRRKGNGGMARRLLGRLLAVARRPPRKPSL